MKKYYIAYGSNLNVEQMRMRCPGARIVGTSVIPDYRLLFKGSQSGAYLTIEPQEGFSVPVAVWAISAADERSLDRYEGFPAFYYKKEMKLPVKSVDTGKNKNQTVFVYIMHEERLIGIPGEWYVEDCAAGYRDFGFDTAVLAEAYEYSRKEASPWKTPSPR